MDLMGSGKRIPDIVLVLEKSNGLLTWQMR
jgi:hypothetical protein